MEKEINIAEILKDKPEGTKLYSSACGKCKLEEVDDKSFKISFYNSKFGFMNGGEGYLDKNGKLYDDGECVVFPSKEMRDWHKFAWKKGDVLISNDGKKEVFFNGFTDDTYALFKAKHGFEVLSDGNTMYLADEDGIATSDYTLETEEAAKTYINTIEERLGGKLNRETLEVEKTQPEFKDGDIVAVDLDRKNIRIFKEKKNDNNICFGKYYIGFSFNNEGKLIQTFKNYTADCSSDCLATEEEKQQLFDALAKEGKRWDAEKKEVVGLKPKVGFKRFDKVLVRNTDTEEWFPGFFEKFDSTWKHPYHIMNRRSLTDFAFKQCIPYDGNEHLLGTTKDVED